MIGGYGGAKALGVMEYSETDNSVSIVLGPYEMNGFFAEQPTYELKESCHVSFSKENNNGFKLLSAEKQEASQKN